MKKYGCIKYFGSLNSESCSYCKSKQNENSKQMWIFNINAESYQYLIDHGWRRSGLFGYKMQENSCCSLYTIRCEALNFKLTKSKRKILKNMKKFLIYDIIPVKSSKFIANLNEQNDCLQISDLNFIQKNFNQSNFNFNQISYVDEKIGESNLTKLESDKILPSTSSCDLKLDLDKLRSSTKAKSKRIVRRIELIKKKQNCDDRKAISILLEKRQLKLKKINKFDLHDYINCNYENAKHKLTIKIVKAKDESNKISFELYKKYQTVIHKSKINQLSFKRFEDFLIECPIYYENFSKNTKDTDLPTEYGIYHMQYWLDNNLIAVNVIDILTECVSSVYFFYDPKYNFLNLGTYSSLAEINLTRKLNLVNSKIKYYYMGYYINNCVKMKYKGNINNSFLLCPKTYKFIPFKYCKENYDLNKIQRLNSDESVLEEEKLSSVDNVNVVFNRFIVDFAHYKLIVKKTLSDKQLELINEYATNFNKKFYEDNVLLL